MKTISKLWQRFWGEPIDNFLSRVGLLLVAKAIHVVLLLVALAVAVMIWDSIATCLQELLGVDEKYDVLKTIGFCVAGVLLVWQAGAANKRAKAMENAAKEQANATKNTEAGLRQERLKNAIEHLGNEKESVRTGGAYELFHLAKDTRDLRQTVLDILCAYIRQTTGEGAYQAEHKTKPSGEIQGLLTLLFAQKHDIFENCSINLQGSCLNGAILIQARLKKADLWLAQLQGAILWRAQLQEAVLIEAQLQRATLWGVQLQGADLSKAKLQEANIINAQLMTSLPCYLQPQLQGADLMNAQLQGAILRGAQLQGANLSKVQLQGAELMGVQMHGVSNLEADPLSSKEFESKIRNRIGKPSDLTGIIFSGGLQQEDLDTLCEGLSAGQAQALREKLRPHVKPEISHELPRDSGAETGTYTQEEAEQWIAEHQEAMQKAPRTDDTANADSALDSDKDKGD